MYNQIDSNKRKTWFLIAIFVAIIALIGYVVGYIYDYGNGALLAALIFSAAMALLSYYGGDKVALISTGAKAISETDNQYIFHLVENLCITAGLPMPKIYLISDPAINAFATGRDPKHASIAVTTGAVEKLTNEELEGVIAHELSHIKNFDIRLMTIVIVLVGAITLLADWFWRGSLFGGRKSDSDSKGNGALMIIGIILLILSPIIAELIKLAISRKREYLADASGSLLTRYPEGLARALEKISQENRPMAKASTATAHLFIANPLGRGKKFLSAAFSTHPPVEDRIKKLREMA